MRQCTYLYILFIFCFLLIWVCFKIKVPFVFFHWNRLIYLANKIIARIYNSASLWLTSVAPASSTSLATVTICNQDVRSLICLSPSIGTASMNFCVTSYGDEIRLAVIVDPTLVPDPHFFTRCFIQQVTNKNIFRNLFLLIHLVKCSSRSSCSSTNSRRNSSTDTNTNTKEKYE